MVSTSKCPFYLFQTKNTLEIINQYFGDFTPKQQEQFSQLSEIYRLWNEKINVISRKDIDQIYRNHVLHSLSIAAICNFAPGTKIVDIGTGGGFPGVPLSIFFPESEFLLVDSIRKKLNVVNEVKQALGLDNVKTHWGRAEEIPTKNKFDFAVSRAVAPLGSLWGWAKPLLHKGQNSELRNGLICLKGGDLHQEISDSGTKPVIWNIHELFPEEYFQEKFVLHVSRS